MSRRKGELERGYKNLFEYCTKRLRLSEGSVARRLQVANVARRFPQILVSLVENRISLTVAGLLAPHLSDERVEQLLSDCEGMTKREVEEYLVTLKPKPVFAPSIRRAPSRPESADTERTSPPVDKEAPAPPAPPISPPLLEPARPDRYNFRFSADGEFKQKFERLAEVLGVENPQMNMAAVFKQAIDIALDKKDPKRKRVRRLARAASGKSRPGKMSSDAPVDSRYISSEVRERVHERAEHQCEFRGPDGTRCSSRTGPEIEHQRPFAIFRNHDERHLRLLCRRHNRYMAERVYGAGLIQGKIDERRRQSPPLRQ